MASQDLRTKLKDIEQKCHLFIKVQKYEAAQQLLERSIDHYPSAANLNLLLGRVYHQQSKFAEAITQFNEAIKKNPNYTEAALSLCITFCDLGQYNEAEEIYHRFQSNSPSKGALPKQIRGNLANSHAENGTAYEKAGLLQEAVQEYRKALSLLDSMPDVKIKLALIYIKTKEFTKAESELREILTINPTDEQAMTQLGIALFHSGRLDEARDSWVKVKKSYPSNVTARTYLRICETQANS